MNYRFRTDDEGHLILQIREIERGYPHAPPREKWRDAKIEDLPILKAISPQDLPDRPLYQQECRWNFTQPEDLT